MLRASFFLQIKVEILRDRSTKEAIPTASQIIQPVSTQISDNWTQFDQVFKRNSYNETRNPKFR